MKDNHIQLAKKRIWKRLYAKLPERETPHVFVVSRLRKLYESVEPSPLKQVQYKEHLLDVLPERESGFSLVPKKVWALGTLGLLVAGLFVPVMDLSPVASAASENLLTPVSGQVAVNGTVVTQPLVLKEGDRVSTGEGALAHVYFVDDSRVTLGPSTEVDIVRARVNPLNRAKTELQVRENQGRVWAQVLNLVSSESYFRLSFPQGEVLVTQKASFDVEVQPEKTSVAVARNLVDVTVDTGALSYEGVLGQGGDLDVTDRLKTSQLSSEDQNSVWWTFNLAYGKSYARSLDANYKQENIDRALILPGNPLYVLKTFRENLQVSLALTSSARQTLLVGQAQNRLNEAQVLLAQGDMQQASQVLDVYQQTVEKVGNTDDPSLIAQVNEIQKQTLVSENSDDTQLLQDHLSTASATVSSDLAEKNEVQILSTSQHLQQVPDLIDSGNYAEALKVLSAYQSQSLSLLSQLDTVPMNQREELIAHLLQQKLADLQLLRVIAAMPEFKGSLDADAAITEQLSVIVLSLREKELGDLSAFFATHEYSNGEQKQMYDRLKDGADLTPQITEQLDSVESQFQNTQSSPVVIEIQPVVDPRFSIPHSDEAQN